MITTTTLVAARVVRLVSASMAIGVMAAVGPLRSFSTPPADEIRAVPSSGAGDLAVAEAIAQQELQGRQCQARPVLTDVVLFQSGADRVDVVSFDEALDRTASRSGWVRGYCV